ncbi:MAG: P1 family peptidase [Deltaproteobacteria bacterium]|nr:P1 family peptidase [Deltaproteobacteria bacterium]MCB9789194.1 P1 family peptidase [Deltaproteobacteria bacterium]
MSPPVSDRSLLDSAPRCRLRDLGIRIGDFATGPLNAITDVAGVRVGHTTLIEGEGPLRVGHGPVRTGVTAVLPNDGNCFQERLIAGGYVLNGAGELSGYMQVSEWGLLESPILLTNTHSLGAVADGAVRYMSAAWPGIGVDDDVVIPLVGECDDSYLNDISGMHVRAEHVAAAIDGATSGPVVEGCVGGGTGMIAFDFKSGIGTSSRRLSETHGGYTVGVLVQSNLGRMEDLRIDGAPVGQILSPLFTHHTRRRTVYGSVIAIVGTDAPMTSDQLVRLSRRAALGIGRVGSYAAHGSGEIVLAFSTANRVPRMATSLTTRIEMLAPTRIDAFFQAAIECTEEAILNALCMATPMDGIDGRFCPAIPLDAMAEAWRRPRA